MANAQQFIDPFFLLKKLAEEDAASPAPTAGPVYPTSQARAHSAQVYSNAVAGYVPDRPSDEFSPPQSFGSNDNTAVNSGWASTEFRYSDLVDLEPGWDNDPNFARPGHAPKGEPQRPYVPTADGVLQIIGQGTIAVRAKVDDKLEIEVHTDEPSIADRTTLGVKITSGEVAYYMRKNGMELPLYKTQIKVIEESCIDAGIETTYWLSIDKENGVVRYGKYWTHKNLTCFEATYKGPNEKGALVWIDEKYKWLAQLRHVDIIQDGDSDTPPTLAILPVAVVMDESPFIVSSDSVTLAQLETGAVTVPANLPEACQRLYGNVTGKEIILNDKEFPNFTDAIEMSCRREDGWCHKRLKTKAGKGDPDATYLRITLGFNYGDSPGVPYVLEIWPPKHYSSVHDHGDACAIIKVLHGEINATYYDTLQKRRPAVIGSPALFQEGQITWLSPTRFQIHKLHNTSDRVCCTIQCYRYEKQDNKHYEAFRFQDGSGEVKDFTPNSDMSYIAFRQQMMKEWNDMMFGGGGK